jgi:ribose 5-phosphate isomerase B
VSRVGVASDHAGFRYKTLVAAHLRALAHEVQDFGAPSEAPVDYPDFVRPCAVAVAEGRVDRGFVFGGSGNGEAMAANRVHGVRCAVAWDLESARLSRLHNDANVLSIGERLVPEAQLLAIVDVWLATAFRGVGTSRGFASWTRCSRIWSDARHELRHSTGPPLRGVSVDAARARCEGILGLPR